MLLMNGEILDTRKKDNKRKFYFRLRAWSSTHQIRMSSPNMELFNICILPWQAFWQSGKWCFFEWMLISDEFQCLFQSWRTRLRMTVMSLHSWLPPKIIGISTLYLGGAYEPIGADSGSLLPWAIPSLDPWIILWHYLLPFQLLMLPVCLEKARNAAILVLDAQKTARMHH